MRTIRAGISLKPLATFGLTHLSDYVGLAGATQIEHRLQLRLYMPQALCCDAIDAATLQSFLDVFLIG